MRQSSRRNRTGLWLLVVTLLFVQILPLHFHNHLLGQEPAVFHHHNVMTYLDDGGDELIDSQVQTVDLQLQSLNQGGDVDMPVLLLVLVLLLALVACYRCRGVLRPESSEDYPLGSYRLPPLRAPPIH